MHSNPPASLSTPVHFPLIRPKKFISLSLSTSPSHFAAFSQRYLYSEAMAVAQGSKSVKKASVPKKSKASPSHPPYIQMITEALVALKERTGSSPYAIAKHIEEEQKVRELPPNFKKLLFTQLKKFVASGKLVKVKNSFKLPPATGKAPLAKAPAAEKPKPKPKAKEAVKPATKKKETVKPKATSVKPKATSVKAKTKAAPVKPKAKREKVEKVKSPVKKVVPAKAKKLKSIKSPVKKAPAAKRARK